MADEFANVPEQLKRSPDWLTWRKQPRDGKIAKKPNIPAGKPWDEQNLLTFKEACFENNENPNTGEDLSENTIQNLEKDLKKTIAADGIGFAFRTYNDIAGVDLDHAIDESGNISPIAKAILNAARGCYVETSLSGSGFHIYGICDKAKMLEKYGKSSFQSKEQGIEVYFRSHYFVVTGNRFMAGWGSIENAVNTCYNLINGINETDKTKEPHEQSVATTVNQTERSGINTQNTNTQTKTTPTQSVAARSNQTERSGVNIPNTNTQPKNKPSIASNTMPSNDEYTDADILRLPAMSISGVRYIMNKEEPTLDNVLTRGYAVAPLDWGCHADGTLDKSKIDMKVCGLLSNYYHRYGVDTVINIFKTSALYRPEKTEKYLIQTANIAFNQQKTWFAAVDYRQITYQERQKVIAWTVRSRKR